MRLIIGNKTYSSWSLRPWLMLRHLDIAFEEIVIPLGQPDTRARALAFTPAGKVPALVDDGVAIWESLAILDHLADRFGVAKVWPAEGAARALARSISSEMHAGFGALRRDCPFNIRRPVRKHVPSPAGLADAGRVDALWTHARESFGRHGAGPFLFGAFSAADAMYAPVVNRFHTYDLPRSDVSEAYMQAIMALPAWKEWRDAAMAETWVMEGSEVP
jgi:glutathione S-transferase